VVSCSVAVLTDITDFGFIREPRKIELLGRSFALVLVLVVVLESGNAE